MYDVYHFILNPFKNFSQHSVSILEKVSFSRNYRLLGDKNQHFYGTSSLLIFQEFKYSYLNFSSQTFFLNRIVEFFNVIPVHSSIFPMVFNISIFTQNLSKTDLIRNN